MGPGCPARARTQRPTRRRIPHPPHERPTPGSCLRAPARNLSQPLDRASGRARKQWCARDLAATDRSPRRSWLLNRLSPRAYAAIAHFCGNYRPFSTGLWMREQVASVDAKRGLFRQPGVTAVGRAGRSSTAEVIVDIQWWEGGGGVWCVPHDDGRQAQFC